MATTNKRFVAKNGLDNNGQTITNVGAAGTSLGLSGTGDLTIAVSGTATLTVPTGTDTLVTLAGIQTVTNKSLSLNTNTLTGTLAEFNTALSDADFTTLTGIETLTNKTLTTPVIAEIDNASDITLDAGGNIILDADGTNVLLKDGGVTFGAFTQSGGELLIKSGATPTTALTLSGQNVVVSGNLTVSGTTFTVDSNTVNIGDNIITLNSDEIGTPSQDGGIEIRRGTSPTVSLIWDEANDRWTIGNQTFVSNKLITTNIEMTGTFTQNGVLVTLTSQDYGLITGIVDNFADYGSIV